MANKYGVLVAKNFFGAAAPELLKVVEGSSKHKEAFRAAEKKDHYTQTIGRRKEWNLSEALHHQHSFA